jgi:hypothetical protein
MMSKRRCLSFLAPFSSFVFESLISHSNIYIACLYPFSRWKIYRAMGASIETHKSLWFSVYTCKVNVYKCFGLRHHGHMHCFSGS